MCQNKGCGCHECHHQGESLCHQCGGQDAQHSHHGLGNGQDIHKILFQKLCCIQKKIETLEEKVEAIGYRLYEEIESVGEKIDDLTQE